MQTRVSKKGAKRPHGPFPRRWRGFADPDGARSRFPGGRAAPQKEKKFRFRQPGFAPGRAPEGRAGLGPGTGRAVDPSGGEGDNPGTFADPEPSETQAESPTPEMPSPRAPRAIDQAFRKAAKAGRKVLIPYVMAGDPNLDVTARLVPALAEAGADVVELGIPFSDPIADGPVILRAAMRALARDVSLAEVIGTVRAIRRVSRVPIVFMSYYNPILQMGPERFAVEAASAGVDGVIVPDLPPEEGADLIRAARKAGLATIFLLAPTSDPGRIAHIARVSTGFLYYVSLTGTTGAALTDPDEVARRIADIRKVSRKPVAVGFGIATPEQARIVGKIADGVIVGSALVRVMEREIEAGADPEKLVAAAGQFVADLRRGLDG